MPNVDLSTIARRIERIEEALSIYLPRIRFASGAAAGGAALTVKEEDAVPTVANVSEIKVTNGTLTDNGSGSVSLTIGGAMGAIDDLTDVTITAAATGDIIRYNGAAWVDYPDSNYAAALGADDNYVTDTQKTLIAALDADLATFSLPASTTITTAGAALIDDAAASNQCTTLGLGTGDSPQFTAVNIGAATDTTITRVSAGVIAVEGDTVVTLGDGGTFTAAVEAADHGTAATDQVINVCYGTGAAPAANTTTEGALFIAYTA